MGVKDVKQCTLPKVRDKNKEILSNGHQYIFLATSVMWMQSENRIHFLGWDLSSDEVPQFFGPK